MTNNELIKELVNYRNKHWIELKISDFDDANTYLTDMNILHRIAVKVVTQLREMYSDDSHDTSFDFEHDMKVTEVKSSVVSAMFTSPNPQGEHLQLAEAIVNAIRYISANKAG